MTNPQGSYKNLIPDYGNAVANRQDLQEQKPQKEGGFTYSSTVDISAKASIKDRNDMSSRLDYIKSLYLNGIFGVPRFTIGKNTQISENKFNDDKTRSGENPNLYTKVSEDLVIDDSQEITIDLDKVKYEPDRGSVKVYGGDKYGFRYKSSDTFGDEEFENKEEPDNKYSKDNDMGLKNFGAQKRYLQRQRHYKPIKIYQKKIY